MLPTNNYKRKDTLLAMTPGQATGMLNTFTKEALKGNVTPRAFADGLFEANLAAQSPDYTRRNIRNTLASPMGRLFINNPNLIPPGALKSLGVNSGALSSLGIQLLNQAKKDGLIKDNVTNEEVAKEFQRPLYSALRNYLKINKGNPEINKLLNTAYPQSNKGGRPLLEAFID